MYDKRIRQIVYVVIIVLYVYATWSRNSMCKLIAEFMLVEAENIIYHISKCIECHKLLGWKIWKWW